MAVLQECCPRVLVYVSASSYLVWVFYIYMCCERGCAVADAELAEDVDIYEVPEKESTEIESHTEITEIHRSCSHRKHRNTQNK